MSNTPMWLVILGLSSCGVFLASTVTIMLAMIWDAEFWVKVSASSGVISLATLLVAVALTHSKIAER